MSVPERWGKLNRLAAEGIAFVDIVTLAPKPPEKRGREVAVDQAGKDLAEAAAGEVREQDSRCALYPNRSHFSKNQMPVAGSNEIGIREAGVLHFAIGGIKFPDRIRSRLCDPSGMVNDESRTRSPTSSPMSSPYNAFLDFKGHEGEDRLALLEPNLDVRFDAVLALLENEGGTSNRAIADASVVRG